MFPDEKVREGASEASKEDKETVNDVIEKEIWLIKLNFRDLVRKKTGLKLRLR